MAVILLPVALPARLPPGDPGPECPRSVRHILLLHSYYAGFTWADAITDGVQQEIDGRGLQDHVELEIEYMDAKRHPDPVYLEKLQEVLKQKYHEGADVDVIIAADDQALHFLLNGGGMLFPDTPVVFCGVNGYEPSMRAQGRELTGVIEAIDPRAILETALRLHPKTEHVLVINDTTRTGQAIEEDVRQIYAEYQDRVDIEYTGDLSLEELEAKAASLSKGSLMILFVFNRDSTGRNFTHEYSLQCLRRHAHVPIYGPWTFYLGQGIVGGMLTSGELQGRAAADLALQVLAGTPASSIPVIHESPNRYMFDYDELHRFGIRMNKLPKDSMVINLPPPSFYEQYHTVVWAVMGTFVVLALLICYLLVNIHSRKKAEAELRFQSMILDQIKDFVTATDMDGRIIYVNRMEEEVFGQTRQEMTGQGIQLYGENPDMGASQDEILRQTRGRGEWRGKVVNIDKHGRERILHARTWVMHDPRGREIGLCGVATDITEQERIQHSLRESEEKFRMLFEVAPVGIILADADGTYLNVNRRCHEIFGVALNVNYSEFNVFKNTSLSEEEQERMRRGDSFEVVRAEDFDEAGAKGLYPTSRSGKAYLHHIITALRDEQGHPSMYMVVTLDITARERAEQERRSLESQMQYAQKLESLGVLAGGIAHDFNNILLAILGNADMALQDLQHAHPARRSVQEIDTAARRAADLTRQMLDYSGQGTLSVAPIDLNELVEELAHMLEVSISKKASLRFQFAHDLPLIEGDATQVRQIVMNLITNASDALNDQSGMIALKTGVEQYDADYLQKTYVNEELAPGAYVYIEVEDTGCGMDEQTRKRLFDPFFTTKFTGRGLGLAAVLGIVRGHRGAVDVHSVPGKGTRIRVMFPVMDGERARHAMEKQRTCTEDPRTYKGTGTVLVVDDEPMALQLAQRMLERVGFEVVTTAGVERAFSLYRDMKDRLACVLLDLTMPEMDGREVLEELRRIHRGIPVIISSGYSENQVLTLFSDEKPDAFIPKPYDFASLICSLRRVLEENAEEDRS